MASEDKVISKLKLKFNLSKIYWVKQCVYRAFCFKEK